MYVKIRWHQHTRVHAHTGPRRHARAPAVNEIIKNDVSQGLLPLEVALGPASLCSCSYREACLLTIAPGHPASLTPTPTVVTVWHTVALSPPRGALCVLPKSVSLLILASLYKIKGSELVGTGFTR